MDNNSERNEELDEFKAEAIEMLESAESDLLDIDKGKAFQAVYGSVFRIFHSLKGAAGMFDLTDLQHHMHSLENILSGCQPRNMFTTCEVTFFLQGVDAARKLLNGEKIAFNYNPITEQNSPAMPVKHNIDVKKETRKSPSEKNGLVIVIDDEPEILEMLEQMLSTNQFEVKTFTNPEEALTAIKSMQPDVVISDMKMPVLTGLDVLKAVKKINPDIPVIFVSGHLTKKILIESLQDGAFAAIEKPFKENAVLTTCLNALNVSKLSRVFNRSIKLILYQFSDLEDFLITQGKNDIAQTMRKEVQLLIEQQKQFRQIRQR